MINIVCFHNVEVQKTFFYAVSSCQKLAVLAPFFNFITLNTAKPGVLWILIIPWYHIPASECFLERMLLKMCTLCTIPHLGGPLHPSRPDKASSWHGSDLRGARLAGKPRAPVSPAAGSLKTGGRSVRPGSGIKKSWICYPSAASRFWLDNFKHTSTSKKVYVTSLTLKVRGAT